MAHERSRRGASRRSSGNHLGDGPSTLPTGTEGVINVVHDSLEMNSHLFEKFRASHRDARQSDRDNGGTSVMPFLDTRNLTVNLDIRKYMEEQQKLQESAGEDSWTAIPEIPTSKEVSLPVGRDIQMSANKIDGKWKSKEKYLKAHYQLIREDAVSPLRDALDKFRRDPTMDDDKTLSIYEKVHITGFTFAQLGIAARIQFSTVRARRQILWTSSKRLISGSLVALSPSNDNFKDKCIVALVAARPISGVNLTPPEIDIYFSESENIQVDPQEEWIMLEAKNGYYEAYRHTLRALQKMSQESFPMYDHVCRLSKEIEPPSYLIANPVIDISAAVNNDQGGTCRTCDVLLSWPQLPKTTLDDTQWAAMQQMITKKFALLQGPPGTGKTYVSKIGIEIIASQLKGSGSPIIIAAQTNHALDQLLRHISAFEPNYIRLGGRSADPEVKTRALFEVRQGQRIPPLEGGLLGKSTHEWKVQTNKLLAILEPLHRAGLEPFGVETFKEHRVITSAQADSLSRRATQWVSSDGEQSSPIRLWLDRALVPFQVFYPPTNFETEEEDEDLEFEQLREHDGENGVNDVEDAESLRGKWCSLNDKYTVAPPTAHELDNAQKILDTIEDLWRVPSALRGPMYLVMQQRLKAAILAKFRQGAPAYERAIRNLKTGKWERDSVYLQQTPIIGMTTTGLSKYRPLIASLGSKVILIEEAAEVIEAPVAVACIPSLEHLILVGDHMQLQGQCAVRQLEGKPFYLNVSLFERMVRNNVPIKTLLRQRRMDPEFRKLISAIYPRLEDHSSVINRPSTSWGMGDVKSFFFDHEWCEKKDSQLSTYNPEEAKFTAAFYQYLLRNGVMSSKITILTFYNGQRKRILREIHDLDGLDTAYHNVKTVDSYQGEENHIVILSLVRSNENGQIGFLENSNRVCVALSRAQLGFYIFGDARLLAAQSTLWQSIVTMMSGNPVRLGRELPICCKNHNRTITFEQPGDWESNHGGCDQPCGLGLPCMHACTLQCHSYSHESVICKADCTKWLDCGHKCKRRCFQQCSCKEGNSSESCGKNRQHRNELESACNTLPITTGQAPCQNYGNIPASNYSALPTFRTDDPFVEQRCQKISTTLGACQLSDADWVTGPAAESTAKISEYQSGKLKCWSKFANGGVRVDDETRARKATKEREQDQSSAETPFVLIDLSPEQQNSTAIRSELRQGLTDGTLKANPDYQPGASRANGTQPRPIPKKRGEDGQSKNGPICNLLD